MARILEGKIKGKKADMYIYECGVEIVTIKREKQDANDDDDDYYYENDQLQFQ